MQHLDLFSGIGGFALAVDAVWPKATHAFCEIDTFCQTILKKHWPYAKIYPDVRTLKPEGHWDLLTGGFPCQPFSQAGRRKGTADDRYLWPYMFAVIARTLPRWVIAENVRGLVTWNDGMVLEKCCADLESIGYEVQPIVIPACAVNAPHRRDRVWIVGHAKHDGLNGSQDGEGGVTGGDRNSKRTDKLCQPKRPAMAWEAVTNTSNSGLEGRKSCEGERHRGQCDRDGCKKRSDWSQDWPAVATRLCSLDDGLPNGLVRPRGWRNAAIKAAGNAIVPQVAIQVMRGIASTGL